MYLGIMTIFTCTCVEDSLKVNPSVVLGTETKLEYVICKVGAVVILSLVKVVALSVGFLVVMEIVEDGGGLVVMVDVLPEIPVVVMVLETVVGSVVVAVVVVAVVVVAVVVVVVVGRVVLTDGVGV